MAAGGSVVTAADHPQTRQRRASTAPPTTTRFPHTLSGWPRKGALELIEYRPAAYSPRVAPTLHPITLAVGEAEHVALVGRSGAGKSTLIAGLARLLPVDTGRMYIDGLEASEVPLMRWRKAMHAIPQEPLILAGTVLHNLEPSSGGEVEEVREEAAWEALRLAGLEDLVLSMPYGLHTHLGGSSSGEGGFSRSRKGEEGEEKEHYSVGLSGGQRQLLALARLLLHRADAKLVLLDEPAAGMEESASARLHAVIHERLHHATLLAITHRLLPLLHLFTRVVVLDHGVLVEDGAPTALLQVSGGHLQQQYEHAPARIQATVKRMAALHRSRGLAAVRGLWTSAHSQGSSSNTATPSRKSKELPASPLASAAPGSELYGEGAAPVDADHVMIMEEGDGGGGPHVVPSSSSSSSLTAEKPSSSTRRSVQISSGDKPAPSASRRGWRKESHATRTLPWTVGRSGGDGTASPLMTTMQMMREAEEEVEEEEEAEAEDPLEEEHEAAVAAWAVMRRRQQRERQPTPWSYGQHGRGAYPPMLSSAARRPSGGVEPLLPSARLHAANAAAAAAAAKAAAQDAATVPEPELSRPSLLRPRTGSRRPRGFATRELPWTVLQGSSSSSSAAADSGESSTAASRAA